MDERVLSDLQRFLREFEALPAVQQVQQATKLITGLQDVVTDISGVRRTALFQLISEGWDHKRLAALSERADGEHLTPTRIAQLLSTGPRPERVLMGTSGQVVVALGGKWEAPKANGPPCAVISADALDAYRQLDDLAAACGLRTTHEVVPPPGLVDLNRRNLVVVGSPRILPPMAQILTADPNHGFAADADGKWYLTEGDKRWRSPSDTGDCADYAYLGRLKRLDGKGALLYLAGIHGAGTRGAARYFVDHLEEIYNQLTRDGVSVQRVRWSMLIRCDYDPETRQILSIEPLTELKTF